jgi:hypothetical protein
MTLKGDIACRSSYFYAPWAQAHIGYEQLWLPPKGVCICDHAEKGAHLHHSDLVMHERLHADDHFCPPTTWRKD